MVPCHGAGGGGVGLGHSPVAGIGKEIVPWVPPPLVLGVPVQGLRTIPFPALPEFVFPPPSDLDGYTESQIDFGVGNAKGGGRW